MLTHTGSEPTMSVIGVLGVVSAVGGSVLAVIAALGTPLRWGDVVGAGLIVPIGVAAAVWVWPRRRFRVTTDAIGITCRRSLGSWQLAWESVREARLIEHAGQLMLVVVPIAGPRGRALSEVWLSSHDQPDSARSAPISTQQGEFATARLGDRLAPAPRPGVVDGS